TSELQSNIVATVAQGASRLRDRVRNCAQTATCQPALCCAPPHRSTPSSQESADTIAAPNCSPADRPDLQPELLVLLPKWNEVAHRQGPSPRRRIWRRRG